MPGPAEKSECWKEEKKQNEKEENDSQEAKVMLLANHLWEREWIISR